MHPVVWQPRCLRQYPQTGSFASLLFSRFAFFSTELFIPANRLQAGTCSSIRLENTFEVKNHHARTRPLTHRDAFFCALKAG